MSGEDLKELAIGTIIAIVNILFAFGVTSLLGITNQILIKSYISYSITYEVLIFMLVSLVQAVIYDFNSKKKCTC